MLETHPFGHFTPRGSKYLLLGSFTGKITQDNNYDWFYGTKRNQFWSIMREVYGQKLLDKKSKEKLFTKIKLAISDIIYQCERVRGSNLDNNLINIVYNTEIIGRILKENKIEKIFFSSRFVENKFKKVFKNPIKEYPNIIFVTLPSPSPRFAAMSFKEKVKRYKELLPKITSI